MFHFALWLVCSILLGKILCNIFFLNVDEINELEIPIF